MMQNASGATVGVAYGTNGDNLPAPSQVVSLLQANNVNKARIYDTNNAVLGAFQNSNIKLMVGARNDELSTLASDGASSWVQSNIIPYASSIEIICVGNEVLTQATQFSQYLFPAIQNVHNALKEASLDTQILVSTTHAMDVIDSAHSFPPSAGAFAGAIQADMDSILSFLSQTGAPFLATVFPFFAYIGAQPGEIALEYALFQPTSGVDDNNGLHYSNLFDAQVDTLIAAMEAMGHSGIPVVAAESGWPHEGDASATLGNAQAYNGNLVAHVSGGTPRRPNVLVSTYIFALFDENLKPSSPAFEQHFGVFDPSSQMKFYDLSF
ncbi:hypothetical protein GOP47_0003970 [Adiantum capillus-veneris]|uniref:Uncharacterized protein n=1 Tax=Adiantum capillus-veneris TaxID=13818 RepID=A0A9D4V8C0_ADICA|nr:hypothetical protein GOP47_0003970 [Adiantum capillus-veneris]